MHYVDCFSLQKLYEDTYGFLHQPQKQSRNYARLEKRNSVRHEHRSTLYSYSSEEEELRDEESLNGSFGGSAVAR